MVRFGIGFAKHRTIYHAAKFNFAWEPHQQTTIIHKHDQMMHLLNQPFGMFHWLCIVIGAEEVKLYAEEGHIHLPSNGVDVIQGQLMVQHIGQVRLRPQNPPAASGSGSQSLLPQKRSRTGLQHDVIEISDDEFQTDDEDLGGATKKKKHTRT